MPTDNFVVILVIGTMIISTVGAILPVSFNSNFIGNVNTKKTTTNVGKAALYPIATPTRDIKSLDGIWNFRLSEDPILGFKEAWYEHDLEASGPVIPMPVPSSYQDVVVNATIRDHTGVVWYDRQFLVPYWWRRADQRVWLRFGSVHYNVKVFLNGKKVTSHEIGHLPFEVEVTEFLYYNASNRLTVSVDNTLNDYTIPQNSGFDFFNYAGIHRQVYLYTTPTSYIEDIKIHTNILGNAGHVTYNLTVQETNDKKSYCIVDLLDRLGNSVGQSKAFLQSPASICSGVLVIESVKPWWPYLMHQKPGYLYTLKASLISNKDEIIDTYSQKIGIRTIRWTNKMMYLNDAPIYLRGFGMHEDSDMRGKGWDQVLWTRNMNLIKWVGANAFRTSHYPYAEEIYQMADEQGIMIIDECPSVNAIIYSDTLLEKHKQSLTELIRRDKNHPSVIMWSIANEPKSGEEKSDDYFKKIVAHVKSMDVSRPVTFALAQPSDIAGKHLDVISFNRYNGWYGEAGNTKDIVKNVVSEAHKWHNKYNRSVLMSEYGADTIAGMHFLPSFIWSEDYQVALMSEHFKAFDALRQSGFFIGEFIWNFADFMTKQDYTRAGGNRKGIFTRSRQPKASAHHLRKRYLSLAAADAGHVAPSEDPYVADHRAVRFNEL